MDIKRIATWPVGVCVGHEIKVGARTAFVLTDPQGTPARAYWVDGGEMAPLIQAEILAAIPDVVITGHF